MSTNETAHSVLNQWKTNNMAKLTEYVKNHGWLKADIQKLNGYIREKQLVQVAVTRLHIYGVDVQGVTHTITRGILGIPPNFI